MRELQMPAASGSATAQHAVGMLMYCFDCESGSKSDFLDAARWIRRAARQGLIVVGL
jgi:TPR repeat protein